MNILFLNLHDKMGGAETIFHLCCKEASAENNCYRLVLSGVSSEDSRSFRMMKEGSFLQDAMAKYGWVKTAVRIWALLRIICMVKAHKIDVVHLHNTHDCLISAKGIGILLKFVPVVCTLHDMWWMTGYCIHSGKCSGWKRECEPCRRLAKYPLLGKGCTGRFFREKQKLYGRKNLYRVCPSKWLYDMVVESGIGRRNLYHIPNGVDMEVFRRIDKQVARKMCGLRGDRIYLLFVAAAPYDKKKGMRYLLEALKTLHDVDNLELLAVGGQHGMPSAGGIPVHWFGCISDRARLNVLYAAADLFVLPSIEDNFPCTALEAMASGTPVAAFGIGGISEQLGGGAGFIAGDVSAAALSDVIREALTDEDARHAVIEKAYAKCRKAYSSQRMGYSYEKLYENVVRRFGKSR